LSYLDKYPNENPNSVTAFPIPKRDKQLRGHESASAMTPQQEVLKIAVNLHALSNDKGRKLASAVEATSKKAHECEKRAQSARHPKAKQAWNKLCAAWKRLEEGQKEDLYNYKKDAAVFGKAKMDLQGGGRSRR
jgi:hypothetical protein